MITMFQRIILSRFVVEFIEEVYPILEIKENKKKRGRPSYPICSMLKLLVYAKIDHIESTRVIEEMAKFHDIYKFVCDRITPDERSIQRYRNNLGSYYEILLQMTLEKAVKKDLRNLITLQLMEPSKKHIILTKI